MKKGFLLALGLLILLPAVPVDAAASPVLALQRPHRGGGHRGGGHHRGGGWSRWGRGWGGGWGWGLGWGWGYPGYGYGYGYPAYRYAYGPPRWAVVDTDVSPEEARVYLDGKYIGLADDFDGYPDYLYLRRGRYRLEFRLEGFQTKLVEVNARPGQKLDLQAKLTRSPGAERFRSYETPPLPEGIRRFWGKRRDVAEAEAENDRSLEGRGYDDREDDRRDRDRDRYDDRRGEERDDEEELREERGDRERDVLPPDEDDERDVPQRRDRDADGWRGSSPKRDRDPDSIRGEGRERSRLRLRIEPSDAAVYLDDRFIGTAEEVGSLSSGIAVSPGKHRVTASRPGFRDRTADVEVDAGETESVELTLER